LCMKTKTKAETSSLNEKSQDNSKETSTKVSFHEFHQSLVVQIYEPQVLSKANIYSPHKVKV
jgi:hypothetical protein